MITLTVLIAILAVLFLFYDKYWLGRNNQAAENPTPTANGWDGYYPVTFAQPNCDPAVVLTVINVANGEVLNPYGSAAKIANDGKATLDMNQMTVKTNFSASGVSGTWTFGNCSGTFDGAKRW